MPLPAQSRLGWQVSMSILHLIAISSTLIRLVHRWQRVYLWWDDCATILPLVVNVLYFAIMWLSYQNKYTGSVFVSIWFTNILFLTILWISRASLALSLARIFPPKHRCRRIAFSLCAVFIVIWIVIVLLSSLECYDDEVEQWWNRPFPYCVAVRPSVKGGVYLVIALDFLADLSLVTAPLTMLWGVKLPVNQRRLVLALFSCSFLSLLASVFFATVGFVPVRDLGPDPLILLDMGTKLVSGVSVIVCNLMVLSTLVYRVSKGKHMSDVEITPDHENGAPATESPSIVIPVTADRRGTSIFIELLQNAEGQNEEIMNGNPSSERRDEHPLISATSPLDITSQQLNSTSNSEPTYLSSGPPSQSNFQQSRKPQSAPH